MRWLKFLAQTLLLTSSGTEDIELATDHIHIKAACFTDLGGNAMAADAKIYAVTDAVAPVVNSVTLTKTTHTQCTVTPNTGTGDVGTPLRKAELLMVVLVTTGPSSFLTTTLLLQSHCGMSLARRL